MATTRTETSPGVFADDAVTSIPAIPITGTAYRDLTTTQQDSEDGWQFGVRVDSSQFNQIMHSITYLLKVMDQQGILGWADAVNYPVGAIVIGSDRVMYRAIQASGPATAVRDPSISTSAGWWVPWGAAAATAQEVNDLVVSDKFVSPQTLRYLLSQGGMAADGWVKLPFRIGTIRSEFTVQWVNLTTGGQNSVVTVNWPTPFPNACFFAFFAQNDVYGSGQSIETLGLVSAKTQTTVSVVNRAVGDSAVGVLPLTGTVFSVGW